MPVDTTLTHAEGKKGQSVRIGDASGPNKVGKSQEAIKEEIRASLAKESSRSWRG